MRQVIRSLFARPTFRSFDRPAKLRLSRRQLSLTSLEDRCTPASFVVTNLLDTGAGSLRDAISQADTNPGLDTITFTVNGTINLASTLGFSSDIDFVGPGASKLIVDGGNLNQVMTIFGSGATAVSLSDMTLTKGKAIGFKGGAIGADSTSLTLTNVTVSSSFSDLFGGGVFVNEGNLTISGSTITGNTVESDLNNVYGGGIAILGSGVVTITNSTVSGNTAKPTTAATLRGIGGGIYLGTTAAPTHVLTNVIITGNTAKGGFGGGVYNYKANLVVTDCVISGNKTTANGTLGTTGGGIESDGAGTLTVSNTTFTNNRAEGTGTLGGAMFIGTTGAVTITNSTFTSGYASNAGGAFWMSDPGVSLISGCTFEANRGDGAGGATRIGSDAGGTVTFENCSFLNNSSGNSGGVFAQSGAGGTINWNNCTFIGNTAAANGSVMRLFGSMNGTVNVNNCTLTGNTANNSGGGAISNGPGPALDTPIVNIVSSIVAENIAGGSAKNAGADLARAAGNGSTTFTGKLTVDFSLIGVFPTLTPAITEPTAGSNLKGNTTTPLSPVLLPLANYGGNTKTRVPNVGSPVIDKGSNPLMLINDQRGAGFTRTFNGKADMGAVEANRPAPTVASVNAPDVVTAGATIYTFSITFQDDNGIDVSTLSTPGAVTVSGGSYVTPETAVFKSVDNPSNGTPRTATFEVPAPGGTFDLSDNGVYSINIVGGKIFDTDSPTPITVNGGIAGTFKVALPQNFIVDEISDVDDGNYGVGKLSLREAIQLANSAAGFDSVTFSPAVFNGATTITFAGDRIPITDSTKVIGPAAELTLAANPVTSANSFQFLVDGFGTLNVEISNLRLINGFRDNNAIGANGGAIGNNDENVTITNCSFDNNMSKLDGGAVGMSGKGTLSIVNSKFTNNFTQLAFGFSGGAVSAAAGTLTITGCEFTNNNADGVGGAILASNTDSVTISNSKFTGNKSQAATSAGGGAIFFSNNTKIMISGCEFTNNEQSTTGAAGAISFSIGTTAVTIENTVFSGNKSVGGDGGALWTRSDFAGTITLNNVTMTGNSAAVNGGAIRVGGNATITVNNSTLSGNTASSNGGGIAMMLGGSLTVNASTLSGNTAGLNGGGIYAKGGVGAALLVSNSTLSGNIATNDGGGISISAFTTNTATIRNSTLTLNESTAGAIGGGGIAIQGSTGTVTISSSIIAQNLNGGDVKDVGADAITVVAGKNNVIGVGDKGNITYDPANQLGTMAVPLDAKLAPLALNGAAAGSPLTHAITNLSPAFNMGNDDGKLGTDQRGVGFNRVSGGAADAGAFEIQFAVPPTVVSVLTNGQVSGQHSLVTSIVITFSEVVTIANPSLAFIINRTAGATGGDTPATGTVGFTVSGLNGMNQGSTVTITFNGSGAVGIDPGSSLRDGKYQVTIVAAQVAGSGGQLDGNANGKYDPMDPNMDNNVSNTWRLFGDGNGDGSVTAADFNDFRLFYGSVGNPLAAKYDINGDGAITAADFNNFRTRYGLSGYNVP